MQKTSLKRALVPTIQRDPDFSRPCVFHQIINNVEHSTYMKFQNIPMTEYRDMAKNLQEYPKNGALQIFDPKISFKNWALQCRYCWNLSKILQIWLNIWPILPKNLTEIWPIFDLFWQKSYQNIFVYSVSSMMLVLMNP